MGGGGTVAAPQPSSAETALQTRQAELLQKQTDILTEQNRQQQLLAPLLFKQAGLTPTMDHDGKIVGFTPIQDPNADLTKSIQTQLLQREQDALQGKLPVDPTLTNELNKEDQTLNQSLQSNLGPGYATSTPGIQALAEQAKRRGELTFNVQTGTLSNAAALQQGQSAQTSDLTNQSLNRILATQGGGNQFASLYGNAANNYANAIQPYQQNQNFTLQAAMANQQAKTANTAGLFQLGGSAIGSGAAIGAAVII